MSFFTFVIILLIGVGIIIFKNATNFLSQKDKIISIKNKRFEDMKIFS